MSAWDWLKDELRRRLGEHEAEALWREYWRRHALDREAAQLKQQLRRARTGNTRARQWLIERGYRDEATTEEPS